MTRSGRPRADQILAGLSIGDATSAAALLMRDRLRKLGYDSDLYAPVGGIMPEFQHECRDLMAYQPGPGDWALHHFGIWSEATDRFLGAQARKVLVYHNITPARFFQGYSDEMEERLASSRARLSELAAACSQVWAVSEYNAAELRSVHPGHVSVFPLPYVRPAATAPDADLIRRLASPVTTILTVGRVAPNKRIEDLMRAFAWYHGTINPCSRLLIVGSLQSTPRYALYLRALARDLQTPNICFEGYVWPKALSAYYELADLYLCASGHEGYCLPLLEAMDREIPVITRASGGTPEAMDGAGVVYDELSPAELAELMHLVLSDRTLRATIMESQRERIRKATSRDVGAELLALLGPPT